VEPGSCGYYVGTSNLDSLVLATFIWTPSFVRLSIDDGHPVRSDGPVHQESEDYCGCACLFF
jgi:hypothetical protein